MSDREGHSGLPPSDDDLSLPKATVAKMITGSFLVVSRALLRPLPFKISATLTKPPPRCPPCFSSLPCTRTPPTYTLGRLARAPNANTQIYVTFHMHARIHACACRVMNNRTPSQRCHLRQGDPRLGHRMLRRSVPDLASRSDLRQADRILDLTSSRIHPSHFV